MITIRGVVLFLLVALTLANVATSVWIIVVSMIHGSDAVRAAWCVWIGFYLLIAVCIGSDGAKLCSRRTAG